MSSPGQVGGGGHTNLQTNANTNLDRRKNRMMLTRFLLLLLPLMVGAITEATTLKGERDADELERVKRGFYT